VANVFSRVEEIQSKRKENSETQTRLSHFKTAENTSVFLTTEYAYRVSYKPSARAVEISATDSADRSSAQKCPRTYTLPIRLPLRSEQAYFYNTTDNVKKEGKEGWEKKKTDILRGTVNSFRKVSRETTGNLRVEADHLTWKI